MTVSFTAANNAVSVAPQDLITSALMEIGVLAAGEALSAEDATWGLEKLQRLIDRFNAMREMIYSHSFQLFSLIPNHAPHTIGPTGDFLLPMRPVKIVSANFILNSGANAIDSPRLMLVDDDWWAAQPMKSLATAITTHLYYDAAFPNGNLNFWPICTGSNQVRLEVWNSLAQAISLTATLGFPQGYWDAIVLSLAESLIPSYPAAHASPTLIQSAVAARKVIMGNNEGPPRISTDSGMPSAGDRGRRYNFLIGMNE